MLSHQIRRRPARHFGVQDLVRGDHHRLILSGELDLVSAADLEVVILRVCCETGALTIDLSKVTFMDSNGLRLVLLAGILCEERRGCAFSVIPGPPNVQRLFEISGTVERVPFQTDLTYEPTPAAGDSHQRMLTAAAMT